METIQGKNTLKRRSFFTRLLGGIGVGLMAGNLLSRFVHTNTVPRSKKVVHVKINPFAVPRTKKDTRSHGA